MSDELVAAGELVNQASTNNARSLRKAYLKQARNYLERARRKFPKDDPAAQAAIRRVDHLVGELEQQFPEIVKANLGLGECKKQKCPIFTCGAELHGTESSCPACGNSVSGLGGLVFDCDWIYLLAAVLAVTTLFYRSKSQKKRKRRKK